MAFLPDSLQLGSLTILEVFDYYDIPRLFLCANPIGSLFLAYNVGDNRKTTEWYYLALSEERICRMKTGELHLQRAFLSPELGYLFHVSVNYIDGTTQFKIVTQGEIVADFLPEEGECLYPQRSPECQISQSLASKARRLNRECLDIRFLFSRQDKHCAPMRHLGNIWVSLQQLVDHLCASADGIVTSNYGKLPLTLTSQSELLVEASYVKSFGSRVIASSPAGMTGHTPLTAALTSLASILDDSLGTRDIKEILSPLGSRCATRYRVLLEQLIAARADLEIQRASPEIALNTVARISKEMARYIVDKIKIVETEMLDQQKVDCIITAYNSNRNTFACDVPDGNYSLSGEVDANAISAEMYVTVKGRYIATIREIVEVNPSTGGEKVKHTLARLEEWYALEQ